uniref:Uncharacterized protein n=1 Tax=Glossina austeni TaxID=7395 RepID=A0A1A9VH59_GLOAU
MYEHIGMQVYGFSYSRFFSTLIISNEVFNNDSFTSFSWLVAHIVSKSSSLAFVCIFQLSLCCGAEKAHDNVYLRLVFALGLEDVQLWQGGVEGVRLCDKRGYQTSIPPPCDDEYRSMSELMAYTLNLVVADPDVNAAEKFKLFQSFITPDYNKFKNITFLLYEIFACHALKA